MPASHPCLAPSSTFSRGIGFALWILSASMPYEDPSWSLGVDGDASFGIRSLQHVGRA